MPKFLLLFLLFGTFPLFGQEKSQIDDWRALNHFLNGEYNESISKCRSLLTIDSEGDDQKRISILLARALMETKQYDTAIEVLSTINLDAAFFKSGISGLIGDCKSEQGKYEEALAYYKNAIHAEWNHGTTPIFLFKAYLCSQKLNRPTEANRYIQTVLDYFPAYSGSHSLEKYLIIDTLTSMVLSRLEINQPETLGIGTINGAPISEQFYLEVLQIANSNAQWQAMQQGTAILPIDPDRVWDSYVTELALNQEYAKLHLYSSDEEMMAYLLATDGFSAQQEFLYSDAYTDKNGNFDQKKLLDRINEMREAEDREEREAWINTADYYQKKIRQEKYFNLIGLISFATQLEVALKQDELKSYKANFFCEKFKDVPNDAITISDQELTEYYTKNKRKRIYQNNRDYRNVLIRREEIAPIASDTAIAFDEAKRFAKMLKKAKDDSAFVIAHSQLKSYTSGPFSTALPKGHPKAQSGQYLTYPESVAKKMETAPIGSIVGPYPYGNEIAVAKIIGRTDEVINARHILLTTRENDGYTLEEAMKIYESVTNENFAEFALNYSEDHGTKDRGGELGDFFFGDMVPTFATFCADAPIGKIGFVQTQFGYHIVQVTKREGKQFPRLALVALRIPWSEESYTIPQQRLETFTTNYRTELQAKSNASINEIVKKVSENEEVFIGSIQIMDDAPRAHSFETRLAKDELFKFAFDPNTEVGEISPIFRDSLSLFALILEGIYQKGDTNFEPLKETIFADLQREKKSNLLTERIQSYGLSQAEKKKKEAILTLSNPQIPLYGYEPNVIGKAIHAYRQNQKQIIVAGNSGIFYIEIKEEVNDSEKADEVELRKEIYQSSQRDIVFHARNALKSTNQIIDNRDLHRLGIRP